MPKIAADTIEQHVRRQTTRILDVARDLFVARGYRGTDLGDIAKSVGLARNSLYRYFPGKDYILVAVMRREMTPFVERTQQLAEDYPDAGERIDAWLDLQMEVATGPCHAMMGMLGDVGQASEELRAQIRILHAAPREVLDSAVAELLAGTGRNAKVTGAMIASMVESAAGVAISAGDVDSAVRELKTSVKAVLEPGT